MSLIETDVMCPWQKVALLGGHHDPETCAHCQREQAWRDQTGQPTLAECQERSSQHPTITARKKGRTHGD